MKLVGAALQQHNDVAAIDIAKLRIGIGRRDLELGERRRGRIVPDGIIQSLINLDAVQGVIIRLLTIAIHRHTVVGGLVHSDGSVAGKQRRLGVD